MRKILMALLLLCTLVSVAQTQIETQSSKLNPRGGKVLESTNQQEYTDTTDQDTIGGLFIFPSPHVKSSRKYKTVIDSNDIAKSKFIKIGGHQKGIRKSAPPHHTIVTAGDGPSCTTQYGVQNAIGEDCEFKQDFNGRIKIAYEYIIIGDCSEIPSICDRTPGCVNGKEIAPTKIYSHIFKNGVLISDQVEKITFTLASFAGQKEKTFEEKNAFLVTHEYFGKGIIKMPDKSILDTCAALVTVDVEFIHKDDLDRNDVFHIFTYMDHHEEGGQKFHELMKKEPNLDSIISIIESPSHSGTHMDVNPIPVVGTKACGDSRDECYNSNKYRE